MEENVFGVERMAELLGLVGSKMLEYGEKTVLRCEAYKSDFVKDPSWRRGEKIFIVF